MLKDIYTSTHPAAKLERKEHDQDEPDVDPADGLVFGVLEKG